MKINLISERAAFLRRAKGIILCRSQKYACVDLLEVHSPSERGRKAVFISIIQHLKRKQKYSTGHELCRLHAPTHIPVGRASLRNLPIF